MKRLTPLIVLFALTGCQQFQTATPAYKQANAARLTAVEPLLNKEAAAYPADAQKVADIIGSWHVEVKAQAATQPVR